MGEAIGIDLGTTYSCVGFYNHGKVEIIANEQGNRTTPSYVAFTDTERLIGDSAKIQMTKNTSNTVFDAKRLIGRQFDDVFIQDDMKHWPFRVINVDGKPKIEVVYKGETKTFFPEEISSMVLAKMKETAEAYLGTAVSKAVITVPAYFNDAQRQATKDAGEIAKLEVLRIINEPTAAAIAYGLEKKEDCIGNHHILIYDLGGGTFDVSVLSMADGVFAVKATAGDTHLGGEDFDKRLVNYLINQFKTKYRKDVSSNKRALRRLHTAAEKAKRTLSSTTQASIEIDSLHDGVDFSTTITRARFEELNSDLFRKTLQIVEKTLKDADIAKATIDEIVLVGGSTRIPKVQNLLLELFGKEVNKSINPDEAVAYGAAVQAAILSGGKSEGTNDFLLMDVAPLSLGIESRGQFMSLLISRNSTIPISKTRSFSTTTDGQKAVHIKVFEGERYLTKDNNLLGCFKLEGYPLALTGTPEFQVTFSIDINGILTVSAVETETGQVKELVIKDRNGNLTREDIERMVQDGEKYKHDDQRRRNRDRAKDSLEIYCYSKKEEMEKKSTEGDVGDKQCVIKLCNDMIEWLEAHPTETEEDYVEKKCAIERHYNQITAKIRRGGEVPSAKRCKVEEWIDEVD